MKVNPKIEDIYVMGKKLMLLSSLDQIAFAKVCGQIEQAQRDEEQIAILKAEIIALRTGLEHQTNKAG